MELASHAAEEYRTRAESRQDKANRYAGRLRVLVPSRKIVSYAVIGLAVFDPTIAVILVPLTVALVPTTLLQSYLSRLLHRERLAVMHCERILLRIDGDWIGDGDTGQQFQPADELFAVDLDVFGRGSLFQFLSTARTEVGGERLAH